MHLLDGNPPAEGETWADVFKGVAESCASPVDTQYEETPSLVLTGVERYML